MREKPGWFPSSPVGSAEGLLPFRHKISRFQEVLPETEKGAGSFRPLSLGVASDQLGDAAGELEGELPPLLGEAAGDVTTGVLDGPLGTPLPNQFQRVKPKNSRTNTSSAIRAAAMPAPAPEASPLVSTTSVPAGLQYRRTL